MSEFTTIQISKETKQKLDLMKGENNLSYNKLIENLLQQAGGTYVEDVITIQRDNVALSLKYWETVTGGMNNVMIYDVTFQEIKHSPVGAVFTANADVDKSLDFVNSVAEVVAKNGDDVILLVKEFSCVNGSVSSVSSVVHVNLF